MASSGVKHTSDKTVGKGEERGRQMVHLNLNQDTLKDLKRHFIVPVCDLPTKVRKGWKISKSESQKGLACEVCCKAMTYKQVKDHIQSNSHQLKQKDHQLNILLPTLRKPSPTHFNTLTSFLNDIFAQYSALPQLEQRHGIATQLEQCLNVDGVDVSVSLFGSSGSGFALTTSNVNINIIITGATDNQRLIAECMKNVAVCLSKRGELYDKVKEDYSSFNKIPRILFLHKQSGLYCEVRAEAGNPAALCTLLKLYSDIDYRCIQLAVLFRLWAKICSVDRQEDGHYPGHMFVLMVIHYLQQIGILPVLHELHKKRLAKDGAKKKKSKEKNKTELHQTVTKASTDEGMMTENVLEDEDDVVVFEEEEEVEGAGQEIEGESDITVKKGEGNKKVKEDDSKNKDKDYEIDYLNDLSELPNFWQKSGINQTLGELWYHLLMYYAVEFKISEHAVSIRQKKVLLRNTRQWGDTRLAVEDPLIPKSNLGRASSSQQDETSPSTKLTDTEQKKKADEKMQPVDIEHQDSSIVFASVQNPSTSCDAVAGSVELDTKELSDIHRDDQISSAHKDIETDVQLASCSSRLTISQEATDSVESTHNFMNCDQNTSTLKSEIISSTTVPLTSTSQSDFISSSSSNIDSGASSHQENVSKHTDIQPHFKFSAKEFVFQAYPLSCLNCKKLKHSILDCPELDLTSEYRKMLPKHIPKPEILKDIHTCFIANMKFEMPDKAHMATRKKILESILRDIHVLYPCAQLEMFGSSANGFGSKNSDLDICLTLPGHDKNARGKIIELIASELAKNRKKYDQIVPITTARVPIVKFFMREWKMQCDISLENKLALRNTKLLAAYTRIDPRVPELGCALKRLAKSCDVCDAATGSLSSYAYILMLLHYLQTVSPPVIPVLQQLRRSDVPVQKHVIDEWDCYYYEFKSTADLREVWSEHKTNTSSTGQLWLGMLRYYTTEFDWNENVVTIKQLSPLSKFDKWWMSKCMCIEDPFNLDHNLGGGITNKMRAYILDRFMDSLLYHSENRHWKNIGELMDPVALKGETRPPKFMRCYKCGSRGHKVSECRENVLPTPNRPQERIVYNVPQWQEKARRVKPERHNSTPLISPQPYTNHIVQSPPHLQDLPTSNRPPYQPPSPQSILPTPYYQYPPGFASYHTKPSILGPVHERGLPMTPSMSVPYTHSLSYPMYHGGRQTVAQPQHGNVVLPHSVGRSPPYRQHHQPPVSTPLLQHPGPVSSIATPSTVNPRLPTPPPMPPYVHSNPGPPSRQVSAPPMFMQLPYGPPQQGHQDRRETRD